MMWALVALTLSACASTQGAATTHVGATLEIENRTGEDLAVSVRGRQEGLVRTGQRLRLHHLATGEAIVSARAQGGAGAFQAENRVALREGERTLWSVLPDAAGGEALPEVPGLATLVVVNATRRDTTLLVGGRRLGRVFAGETRAFDDLPSGEVEVVARPDDGTAPANDRIVLVPEGETRWSVEASGAPLTIQNHTDEALSLTIDGRPRGRIEAGATWSSPERPGLRVVAAKSQPSLKPYETLIEVKPEIGATWEVLAAQAVLEVDNATAEALVVSVPGAGPARVIEPRQKSRFEGVPTGSIEVAAEGQTSKLPYAARLELAAGQVSTWVVGAMKGSIRVENRTRRAVSVYVDTGSGEREAGQVAAGATAIVRDLPRGNVRIAAQARGVEVTARVQTTLDLAEIPAATWVVTASTGALSVDNERDESLAVYVDARWVGEVPARRGEVVGSRAFTGLEVGARLVECVGRTSGSVVRDRITIVDNGLARFSVQDPTSYVEVDNQSGETLELRGVLSNEAPALAVGASLRVKVRAGTQKLVVVGRETGLLYGRELVVEAGQSGRWTVSAEPAQILVWSRLDETVALSLDDRPMGTLSPNETVRLGELGPGRHTLQAVGLRSGVVRAEEIRARPGAETKVTLSTSLATIIVDNQADEQVEVVIDGAIYGRVAARTVKGFGKLSPGPHAVDLELLASHRTQRVALELREGQRARVVAEAPMSLLVIENAARQDVRVSVDGVVLRTVPADAGPTLVPVPAGTRLVQIERLSDRTQLGFKMKLFGDVAVHVPVPPRTVRLVVVNRSEVALSLSVDDHVLGTLAAKSSEMFEAVQDGDAWLRARGPDGKVTHEERRVMRAGETATWVLDAAP